ncbi:MAG: biotin/lipoyl-binding protein [Saprospirales bacterium]|nr:biotin/lipoyl-binding protein [Saprospirales bacterium]
MPFIYVPISICSLGIIQSKKERCNITIPINGTIQNIAIINNQKIKKGDTLLQIDATPVNIEIDFNEKNIHQLNSQLNDLNNLAKYTVENAYTYIPTIRNEQYISVKNQFEKEMQAQQDKLYYLQNSEQRQTILYQKKINAKVDLEKATYEYTFAQNEYKIFISDK